MKISLESDDLYACRELDYGLLSNEGWQDRYKYSFSFFFHFYVFLFFFHFGVVEVRRNTNENFSRKTLSVFSYNSI